ncbi:MAG: carbon-nitrogen hydrolase family protein [Candidatus Omnitrophica bacterium]|nr:carbon-nitrogen hydrolase family protein [Candidatus Omnitrophota bacterium]
MARYVKISNISAPYHSVKLSSDYQDIVNQIKEYLDSFVQAVLPDKPDLIVLPEVCDRPENLPQDSRIEYYKVRGTQILDYFKDIAKNNNCYIAYSSVMEGQDGIWRNSTRIIDRRGNIAGIYHKNHLVIEENTVYGLAYGTESPVIRCDFGTVACAICFDLNFDKLRLQYVEKRPEIVIFCSAFNGGLMQRYWAYSVRAYFVGSSATRPGTIISPIGDIIASTTNYTHYVTADINLDCCIAHIDYNWEKFLALKKKYGRGVKIYDPGLLGSVFITCEMENKTIQEIVKEFEIELLDDYFKRALTHRQENIK